MINSNISYYSNAKSVENEGTLPLDFFLDGVQNGKWLNEIIDVNSGKKDKKLLPAVTISGEFSKRKASQLIKHSGYICIDIDNQKNVDETKDLLKTDRFVTAAWKSVSGKGLAVLFKIDPRRHLDAFNGLGEYLLNNYGIVIDQACKDVSRLRFVSYDPDLYINEAALKFTNYPKPQPKALKKLPKTIFVMNDFDEIISQIENRGLDLVDDYNMWLAVAFGLADQFGSEGMEYFHRISRIGSKYKYESCVKQYEVCLKRRESGVTIATFYWLCKQAGVQTISEKTKLIATTASQAKKGGRQAKDTVNLLKEIEGISELESAGIVQQVFDNDIDFRPDDSFVSQLEVWLRQNYDMRRNVLTRKIENNGEPLEDREMNSVYIQGKKIFEKELTFDIFSRLIYSDFSRNYNPLTEWFEQNKDRRPSGNIDKLCQTIKTDMSDQYVRTFVTKWLIGIIEAAHGEVCALMLVLAGEQQSTGKTEWFRRLLPREIRQYYAESKMDKPKDDEILMTQKLIIMDDEMGGKSKTNVAKLKELTSKKWFSLREPYGRQNVDLRRLAVLAGTSNELGLLFDPTGNRRILPIHVLDIDKELYNSIDKTDLFIEVYNLWKEQEMTSELSREQISYLNEQTDQFNAVSIEKELIQNYFSPAVKGKGVFMTTTGIKAFLEKSSMQRVQLNKLGQELRNLGFEVHSNWDNGSPKKGYWVYFITDLNPA